MTETNTTGKIYRCGTLTYTKMALVTLFAWLLWGDFCFSLMETVGPSILPLKLKALGASNTSMSWIMTVLPNFLTTIVCPWVSFKSDRYRSRWGRRIPFILSTMPFLTISLILLGWSEPLTPVIRHLIPALASVAPATTTIWLIAIFLIVFQFFNMFVNSVFWYLFNDVVPPQFLGRFMGLFRIMGTAAGASYNFFIFKYAETNMREIITGGALLYFIGFGVMCFFVKEGKYPPPPDMDHAPKGLNGFLKTFGKQSFSTRFYWYFYLMNAFGNIATACAFAGVLFSKQMGLSVDQIGKLSAYGAIAALLATYFTAIFVDRWHPLRISTYMAVFTAVTGFSGWIWTTMTLPGPIYFWLCLGASLVTVFSTCLQDACAIPLFMRLMPKSLYGQFSSANALVRSVARIGGGILVGPFLDFVQKLCHGSDYAYRWMFVWSWVFGIGSTVFICLGYREWKRLGGDEHYHPPAPWLPQGYEEITDRVPSVPARPRAVMTALWLVIIGTVVNLLFVTGALYFMRGHGFQQAAHWHIRFFIPAALFLLALQYMQLVHVRRDIITRERGESTRLGVPHHGVLLVNAIQSVVGLSVYWYQTVMMISLNRERELMLFSIAILLVMGAGVLGTQIIRWIERPPAQAVKSSRQPENSHSKLLSIR